MRNRKKIKEIEINYQINTLLTVIQRLKQTEESKIKHKRPQID